MMGRAILILFSVILTTVQGYPFNLETEQALMESNPSYEQVMMESYYNALKNGGVLEDAALSQDATTQSRWSHSDMSNSPLQALMESSTLLETIASRSFRLQSKDLTGYCIGTVNVWIKFIALAECKKADKWRLVFGRCEEDHGFAIESATHHGYFITASNLPDFPYFYLSHYGSTIDKMGCFTPSRFFRGYLAFKNTGVQKYISHIGLLVTFSAPPPLTNAEKVAASFKPIDIGDGEVKSPSQSGTSAGSKLQPNTKEDGIFKME